MNIRFFLSHIKYDSTVLNFLFLKFPLSLAYIPSYIAREVCFDHIESLDIMFKSSRKVEGEMKRRLGNGRFKIATEQIKGSV